MIHMRSSQQEYVLEALQSGKHVLLNDPVSTGMAEFLEQQKLAKKYGKFIQFSTMFVHQFQGR
jgi:predicted dehydrogenase